LILVDRRFEGYERSLCPAVDDELVGRMATEHLVGKAGRRIAVITAGSSTAQRRLAGYRRHSFQPALITILSWW
jgi:DNA-binding LacI/PurR family transcriptional regulator